MRSGAKCSVGVIPTRHGGGDSAKNKRELFIVWNLLLINFRLNAVISCVYRYVLHTEYSIACAMQSFTGLSARETRKIISDRDPNPPTVPVATRSRVRQSSAPAYDSLGSRPCHQFNQNQNNPGEWKGLLSARGKFVLNSSIPVFSIRTTFSYFALQCVSICFFASQPSARPIP